jgi:plastocyanin
MRNTSAIARSSFLALLLGFSFANCSTREEKTKEISIKGEVAPKSKVHTLVIERMQFSPSDVYVNKGETVMWVNKDLVVKNLRVARKIK